jgi:hypothetical protein
MNPNEKPQKSVGTGSGTRNAVETAIDRSKLKKTTWEDVLLLGTNNINPWGEPVERPKPSSPETVTRKPVT